MSRERENYEVGHGRPPVQHRFQKGQSGNPSGRPKRRPTFTAVLEQALNKTIPYREGDQTKRATALYVLINKILHRALKDDPKAMDQLVKILLKVGPEFEKCQAQAEDAARPDYTLEVRQKIEKLVEAYAKRNQNTSNS